MNLSDQEIEILKDKAAAGGQLNDLQKVIQNDFGKSITFMETRFLVSDFNIHIMSEEELNPKKDEPEEVTSDAVPPNAESIAPEGMPDLAADSKVQVSVDQVTRPGMMTNGTVTWSDGETAMWYLDQAGQLGVDAGDPTYQPSPEDIEDFQIKLRNALGA